jgi:hypothetical protein
VPAAIDKSAPGAEGGKEAKHDPEDIEQEDARHKGGGADPKDAEQNRRSIQPAALFEGGERAQGYTEAEDNDGAVEERQATPAPTPRRTERGKGH